MDKKEKRAVVRLTKEQIKLLRRALIVLDPAETYVVKDILLRFFSAECAIFDMEKTDKLHELLYGK